MDKDIAINNIGRNDVQIVNIGTLPEYKEELLDTDLIRVQIEDDSYIDVSVKDLKKQLSTFGEVLQTDKNYEIDSKNIRNLTIVNTGKNNIKITLAQKMRGKIVTITNYVVPFIEMPPKSKISVTYNNSRLMVENFYIVHPSLSGYIDIGFNLFSGYVLLKSDTKLWGYVPLDSISKNFNEYPCVEFSKKILSDQGIIKLDEKNNKIFSLVNGKIPPYVIGYGSESVDTNGTQSSSLGVNVYIRLK